MSAYQAYVITPKVVHRTIKVIKNWVEDGLVGTI